MHTSHIKSLFRFCFLVTLGSLTTCGDSVAEDWPAWRGPHRDDVSRETGLLQAWPAGGPAKLWTSTQAGVGYSGIAISGGVLYTMGADEDSEYVVALDVSDGSRLWQTRIGDFLPNGWGGGPRSTPTVAGDLVVAIGGKGNVVCLSTADGDERWSVSMTEMGGEIPRWGYSESALVDGSRVLCTPGGSEGTIACLDLETGRKIWQSVDIDAAAQYASILAVDHFGARQYIQLTMTRVFGLNADGSLLWSADWPGSTAVIPTPVYHDGQVYVTAGYGAGCMLLNIGSSGQVEKLYENKIMKNHHGGVLLLGDHIYGHSDAVGWICQNFLSGELVWNEEGKNSSKGSLTYADGRLYCLEENTGHCILAEATPEMWNEISRFRLSPQSENRSSRGKIWTHPVVSNGRLFLRDQEIICCYDISSK